MGQSHACEIGVLYDKPAKRTQNSSTVSCFDHETRQTDDTRTDCSVRALSFKCLCTQHVSALAAACTNMQLEGTLIHPQTNDVLLSLRADIAVDDVATVESLAAEMQRWRHVPACPSAVVG